MQYRNSNGFTLPVVLTISVIMLIVLASGLQLSATSSQALREQYYNQLAREAAEAGVRRADECIKDNAMVASWSAAHQLRPNTDCRGVVLGGVSDSLIASSGLKTTYYVGLPVGDPSGVQRVPVAAVVQKARTSDNSVSTVYSQETVAIVGGNISFSAVTFGYNPNGVFLGNVYPDGRVTMLGANPYGQLGNGTVNASATPTNFILPQDQSAKAMYTNFLAVGYMTFVVTDTGSAYGAGRNESGQLGNGSSRATQATPVQFGLPPGVRAASVIVVNSTTFVVGSDNNVYAAGNCIAGILGNNYSIPGCSNQWNPVRVALPPVTSDSNTKPVTSSDWVQSTHFTADSQTALMRMQGGAVYAWGGNSHGQLANNSRADSSQPVRLGSFGMSGSSRAVQVAFDGITAYILDDAGDVYASGANMFGQLAGALAPIKSSNDLCMDNIGNGTGGTSRLRVYTCNDSVAQRLEWRTDGTIRFRPDATSELCLGYLRGTIYMRRMGCVPNDSTQQWRLRPDGSIYNPASGKCIDVPGNSATSGTNLQLYACNGSAAQRWSLGDSISLQKIPFPTDTGKFTRITTDMHSVLFLTDTGQVWGAGRNDRGQLGVNESQIDVNPVLRQFIGTSGYLGSTAKARDVYTTASSSVAMSGVIANTFVVYEDGSVFGVGDNRYGQVACPVDDRGGYPRKLALPDGVMAKTVQSGLGTTVVLTTTGQVYTVGNNQHGQLGDGTTTSSCIPKLNRYTNGILPLFF